MSGCFREKVKKSGDGEEMPEVTVIEDGREIEMRLYRDMFRNLSHLNLLSNLVNHFDLGMSEGRRIY